MGNSPGSTNNEKFKKHIAFFLSFTLLFGELRVYFGNEYLFFWNTIQNSGEETKFEIDENKHQKLIRNFKSIFGKL